MKPTLNQLMSFCTVAEVGNIGRAADKLNISQPPLSRQIAQLERDVGAKLFTRNAKGMKLTFAGEQFLKDAYAVLRMMQQACSNVQAVSEGQMGLIKLGATMYASYSVVPQLVMKHRMNYPSIDLQFQEMIPTGLNAALGDGRLDVAISFSEVTSSAINSLVLLREPLIVALPADHPQANVENFDLETLANDPFIIVPRPMSPLLYDRIFNQCLKAGFSPHIGVEVSVQQTIVNFVAHGLGVAIIPASMATAQIRGINYRRIADANTIENILMWSSDNKNPALEHFINQCRALAEELSTASDTRISS